MGKIYQDITELIGHTPLMELSRLAEAQGAGAKILGKLESFNPAGSVKDRVAKKMIEDAEASRKTGTGFSDHRAYQRQYRHRPGGGGDSQGVPGNHCYARYHERRTTQPYEGLRRRSGALGRFEGNDRSVGDGCPNWQKRQKGR